MKAKDRLIVALDIPWSQATPLVGRLRGHVGCFKVGLGLFCADGNVRNHLPDDPIFLDLKLHDIPATVSLATKAVLAQRPRFMTVHAAGGIDMVRAAVRESRRDHVLILAVTKLTSQPSSEAEMLKLANDAGYGGADGVVCAVEHAPLIRREFGAQFVIVCPGIRPAGGAHDDHFKVATPRQAIDAGADYFVVGRPITRAADPLTVVANIIDELQ